MNKNLESKLKKPYSSGNLFQPQTFKVLFLCVVVFSFHNQVVIVTLKKKIKREQSSGLDPQKQSALE